MNYAALADKAAAAIEKNGKAATIVRPGTAEGWTKKFNALTGAWYWENEDEETTTIDPATATAIPCFVLEDRFLIKHIDGTLVRATDRLFLCTAQPVLGDQLHVDKVGDNFTTILTVEAAIPLRPGEVTIYTEVQAR